MESDFMPDASLWLTNGQVGEFVEESNGCTIDPCAIIGRAAGTLNGGGSYMVRCSLCVILNAMGQELSALSTIRQVAAKRYSVIKSRMIWYTGYRDLASTDVDLEYRRATILSPVSKTHLISGRKVSWPRTTCIPSYNAEREVPWLVSKEVESQYPTKRLRRPFSSACCTIWGCWNLHQHLFIAICHGWCLREDPGWFWVSRVVI